MKIRCFLLSMCAALMSSVGVDCMAQPCDCQGLLKLQYDRLAINDDRTSLETMNSWYRSDGFRMWKQDAGRGMEIEYQGVKLGGSATDSDIRQWQQQISTAVQTSVSQTEKFSYLRSKGLEAVVAGYVECMKIVTGAGGMGGVFIDYGTPSPAGEDQVVVTLKFLRGGPTRTTTKIKANGVTLIGLEEIAPTPRLVGGGEIPVAPGISVAYRVKADVPNPTLVLDTEDGSVVVPVPMRKSVPVILLETLKAQVAKLELENKALKSDRDAAVRERDEAVEWLNRAGRIYRASAESASIYVVWGRQRVGVQNAGWHPSGLAAEIWPGLDAVPIAYDGKVGMTCSRPDCK